MAAAVLAGAAVAGAGLQIYGTVKGASAQAQAARQNAAIKAAQAQEIQDREIINEDIINKQSVRSQLAYESAAAGTGFSNAGLGGVLRLRQDLATTLSNVRRDADFKASMLRAGADIDTNLASDAVTASYIASSGTVLTTGANIYNQYKKGSSQSLPSEGSS